MKTYYTYILQCSDGSFYTGYAADMKKRLEAHNKGEGARYTRGRIPVSLVYQEPHQSRSQAMIREAEIKKWSRTKKQELISSFIPTYESD